VVESFNLHVGDLLNPNETAAIVDEFVDPYVYLYASQRDLAALGPGTRLRLSSDAGAGDFDGLVEAHDRSAQFTPQTPRRPISAPSWSMGSKYASTIRTTTCSTARP
jgi:hypothetical protein